MNRHSLSLALAGALGLSLLTGPTHAEERIGPFEIDAPDGAGKLGIGFATQFRGRVNAAAVEGESHEITPAVNIPRLSLLLRGKFLEDDALRMGFQMNTTPGALEVLDVWAQYNFDKQAQVRAGVYKIPFTVHRAQGFGTLVLTDWGLGTRHFGAERQMGLMINNFKAGRFRYALGVFMGENMRSAFATRHTAFYGESRVNPSDLTTKAELEEPHPELVAQVGWGSKDVNLKSNSDAKGGKFRYHISGSAAFDARPTITRDLQLRVAPEIVMKWKGVSLNAVFYAAFAELSEEGPLEGFAPAMYGPQATLAYRPHEMFEVAARYALVLVTPELQDDANQRGQTIVAAASEDDVAVVSAQYENAGLTTELHEVSGGVNLYLIGHSLKWQTDFGLFPRVLDGAQFNDWRVTTQFQVAF
jgi:hypothetical protein